MEPRIASIVRYLGGNKGQVELDEAMIEKINQAHKKIAQLSKDYFLAVEAGYKNNEVAELNLKLPGESIKKHLENYDKVVLTCTSLGAEVDQEIKKLAKIDMASSLILDATASDYVQQLHEQKIKEKMASYTAHTFPFAIGYGDLPLATQDDFVRALNVDKMFGIHLSASHLMSPQKTITAIIGVKNA
ncbi:MAG: hypothetical protein LBN08_04950 [Lactobacillales bacterium]|jgi:hypothetical protein|nr:hypothetical protein [Lactobacillales bacterium]